MGVKIEGFDEFEKELKKMEQGAKKLEGKQQISLGELLSDKFIQKHTSYVNIEALFESGGFKVNSEADFAAIPQETIDVHVKKNTRFATFQEMINEAVKDYVSRQLGF